MITEPKLPPRAGYVEVEIDGKRCYESIQTPYADTRLSVCIGHVTDLMELAVDQALQLALLELGLTEGGEADAVSDD